MPGELPNIINKGLPNSGRFVRTQNRIAVTDGSVEPVMSHRQLEDAVGIKPSDVTDAGIYSFIPKTIPPTLSFSGIGGDVEFDPNVREATVNIAHKQLKPVNVVGYDDRGKTDAKNIIHRRS